MDSKAFAILQGWLAGRSPTQEDYQQLEQFYPDSLWDNTLVNLQRKCSYFQRLYPEVVELCQSQGIAIQENLILTLWRFWLPFSLQLHQKQQKLGRPLVQGVLGGQGTGKTTLGEVVQLILSHLGCRCVSISLDDLYKTYAQRQQLQEVDPRLIWRGPPGTHDIQLGINVLEQLRRGDQGVAIPRFDKSAYGGAGEREDSEVIASADVILFEGWFVGLRTVNEAVFDDASPFLNTPEDVQFARDMNRQLEDYLPLWEKLDSLLVMLPQDYRWSLQWRQEAEAKMRAQGRSGMSDVEIERFVEYFWKALHPDIFLPPLIRNRDWVDLVVEVKRSHEINKIYSPS